LVPASTYVDSCSKTVYSQAGLRGVELAVRLGVEPPTVTKMLQRLEGCTTHCSYAVFATIHGEASFYSHPLRGRKMVNGDGKEHFSKVM
jgi:hypothetical protein